MSHRGSGARIVTRNLLSKLALRASAEAARAFGPRGTSASPDIDEETRRSLAEFGLDLERDNVEAVTRRLGLHGSAVEQWSQLAALGAKADDPWAAGSLEAIQSISGPTPIQFLDPFDADPLVFTFELPRPVTPAQLTALSTWVAENGARESDDDRDHVSSWSEARPVALRGSSDPAVMWHYDAATAGPDTVRRLIEEASEYGAQMEPRASRLIIGHVAGDRGRADPR
jgi:hypothetical protein